MEEIDLSQLPTPKALEEFDFETILVRRKQRLIELCPESIRDVISATLELKSEPLTIDLEQQAYSELLLRQRINEAARSTFLAFAVGSDLDHIGASRNLKRKIIQVANPYVSPPIDEILESDTDFRKRIQLHPEKYAAAGPRAAYRAHALNLDDVADANPISPVAGTVRVYIKSYSNGGIPSPQLLQEVQEYLSAETRRPLCDLVEVQAARAKIINIEYETEFESALAKNAVKQAQNQALEALFAQTTHLSGSLALSKIIGALDVVGAKKVVLIQPNADVVCSGGEFIRVGNIISREI